MADSMLTLLTKLKDIFVGLTVDIEAVRRVNVIFLVSSINQRWNI